MSSVLTILAAQVPDKPAAPVTSISGSNVLIKWDSPDDGSTQITSYLITIRQSDGSYTEDSTNCNGTQSAIRTSLSCLVPISSLIIQPYNIVWGSQIWAKVVAINIKGSSATSDAGTGAIILTNPDAPLALANVAAITLATQIGLTWNIGLKDGGSPVIDYQVSFIDPNVGTGYAILQSGITTTTFTATGLSAGTNYAFVV